jgi:thymidylate kinase
MLITILGPDGTGKTTLAKLIAEKYSNIDYIYFGNNLENRKYKFFSNFLYANRNGKINTLLKYIFIFINDFYYFHLAKNNHIISDRCPIDKYIGSGIKKDKTRMHYHWLTLKLFPNPDYVILLQGDPAILYLRKKEIPKSVIISYMSLYEKYIKSRKINFSSIDTTKNGIQATLDIASKQVDKLLGER